MQTFDDLIQSYIVADQGPDVVRAWYQKQSPPGEVLSALAERIGAAFLSGQVSFGVANGLLNQLMPLVGFEAAPKRFWQYYVAFENSETSASPDSDARSAVAALAQGAA